MKIQNINLRTSLVPITSLNLNKAPQETLLAELAQLKSSAPDLFRGLPCVLGMKDAQLSTDDLESLVGSIRALGLAPIGLKDAGEELLARLPSLSLADFGQSKVSSHTQSSTKRASVAATSTCPQDQGNLENKTAPDSPCSDQTETSTTNSQQPEPPSVSGPSEPDKTVSSDKTSEDESGVDQQPEGKAIKILSENVRSGQQIHFDGDLVIQGMVNAGAEVLATGNIQIMGSLRGKALAGLRGDEQAYVSCAQFYAEMVSIAGQYQLFDDAKYQGQPVVIRLQSDKIVRIGPNS
jgi:septum site-determining protein MinC